MRNSFVGAAAMWLVAVPVWAQSPKEVRGPLTLTPNMVMCTNVPVTAPPAPKLTVKGIHTYEKHLLATTKAPVVVGRSPDDGLAVGQRYTLSRLHLGPFGFPRPGEGYGDVRVTGVITITAVDEQNAMASIDLACDGIEPGDFLQPYVETATPGSATALDVAPDFSDRGNVLFGSDNRLLLGTGDVLSIDRGTAHGTVPGARYAIYRDHHNGIPLVYLGEIVVMTTSEQTSKVVITKTVDGVEPGDIVVPRRSK
ncbi:MAG TPA: hypothetical protein VF491_05125 [Vicinamibacterales bacterium]